MFFFCFMATFFFPGPARPAPEGPPRHGGVPRVLQRAEGAARGRMQERTPSEYTLARQFMKRVAVVFRFCTILKVDAKLSWAFPNVFSGAWEGGGP